MNENNSDLTSYGITENDLTRYQAVFQRLGIPKERVIGSLARLVVDIQGAFIRGTSQQMPQGWQATVKPFIVAYLDRLTQDLANVNASNPGVRAAS